jgi:hypothetical protein
MSVAILEVGMATVGPLLIFSLLTSASVKYFARSLRYIEALTISAVGWLVGVAILLAYYFAKAMVGISKIVYGVPIDTLMIFIVMCVVGTLITRQAQTYGVKKSGIFGVGAKSIVGLVALSCVFVGLIFGLRWLSG